MGVRLLASEEARFDVVFADPPYESGEAERVPCDASIVELLAPDGILIIERSKRKSAGEALAPLVLRETRNYGETAFDWYERREPK